MGVRQLSRWSIVTTRRRTAVLLLHDLYLVPRTDCRRVVVAVGHSLPRISKSYSK